MMILDMEVPVTTAEILLPARTPFLWVTPFFLIEATKRLYNAA
jgi:hypothetical protein